MIEVAEIEKRRGRLQSLWAPCHAQMDEAEALSDGDIQVNVRKAAPGGVAGAKHVPPTAYHVVSAAAGAILTENVVVTMPPRKQTEKEQQRSDKLEKFAMAVLRRVDKLLPLPLLYMANQMAMLYGLCVIKSPLWNPEAPDKPQDKADIEAWELQRMADFPIITRLLDPRTVVFDLGTYPPRYVIEQGYRSAEEVKDLYGITLKEDTQGQVSWTEYWDKDEVVYIAGGREVKRLENNGHFLPYIFVFTPFGHYPYSL